MKRAKIFYGKIQIRIGKELKTIDKAVWKEGDSKYEPHKNNFKQPAYIFRIIECTQVGTTNY
jgi:hypothetical protein